MDETEALAELADLGAALAAAEGWEELVQAACAPLCRLTGASAVGMALGDPAQEVWDLCVGASGRSPARQSLAWAAQPGPEAEVMRRRAPLLVEDLALAYPHLGDGSWLGVPLLAGERLRGLLFARAERPRAFGERELALLRAVGAQMALALEAISARRKLAAANEARIEFVSAVAHELRTPMTAIKGYTDMLLGGMAGELTEIQRRFLTVVKNNADRLGLLVGDLPEVSRLEAGRIRLKPAALELAAVIAEAAAPLRGQMEEKGLSWRVALPEGLPPAWADRERLLQILSNLLSNAVKYTPPGGHIEVRAAPAEGGQMQVDVSDTGIGIAPQEQGKVFQPFFRADHDLVREQIGTGLGLVLVKGLVELHGGRVWFRSEPGRGSTFSFTVPAAPDPTPALPELGEGAE